VSPRHIIFFFLSSTRKKKLYTFTNKCCCSCLRLVAFKETPSFNPRRRKSGVLLSMRHSMSSNAMMLDASSIASSSTTGSSSTPSPTLVYSSLTSRSMNRRQQQQPSPSPSSTDRWLESNPMCMSTVSVRSDTGSSSSCTAESEDNGSSLTGNDWSEPMIYHRMTKLLVIVMIIVQTKSAWTNATLSVIARG
jgi:hypothetical protein